MLGFQNINICDYFIWINNFFKNKLLKFDELKIIILKIKNMQYEYLYFCKNI